ncbi:MAG: hypothetical protein PVJ34_18850, partial [Anaerolineae bacterium]
VRAGTIRAQGNRPSNLQIPAATLQRAGTEHKFDSKPTFIDHPTWIDDYPSLRNLAGVTLNDCHWSDDAEGVIGTIRLYDTEPGRIVADLFDAILDDQQQGEPIPDVGLSAVLWCKWERIEEDDLDGPSWAMTEIRHVDSIDFVFNPGADGRVDAALTALSALGHGADVDELPASPNPRRGDPAWSPPVRVTPHGYPERTNTMPPNETHETEAPEQATNAPLPDPSEANLWLASLQQASVEAMIAASGLPAQAQARLRSMAYDSPEDVEAAIGAEREYLAELNAANVIQVGQVPPRDAGIVMGRTGREELEAALEALIQGVRPPDGVRPLTGIREAYHLLSGDYEMTGLFHPDRVYLANVNSSTMAGLVANALNKVVVNMFMQYPHWWAPAVTEMDFSTLQDARWITLGGVGELPTVSEGAAYTELTWDDQTETDSFVKKGGYLGITLEAIDKDDTRRLQAAPRALAQAAWLTLGKSISAIFTDNSGAGPAMSDSNNLFDSSNHGNLLTTALSWTAWEAVRVAMMKQTEVNSSERLGALTRPKLLWVPPDLETTGIQILASEGEPGTADNDVNPFSEGNERETRLRNARDRVITCPLWTDTNNWAAQADPMLYPSIGLGYRYGRTPEIFSVASPTAGLMFSNDVMPVKVRFFYAVGPTDWRGLHKNNVS